MIGIEFRTVEYKGFHVSQSVYNCHVIILKDDKMVLHSACDKILTNDELCQMVDNYLLFVTEMTEQ